MLGYFLSPAVSGWIMSWTSGFLPECKHAPVGSCPQSFVWGFRVVLMSSFFALLFITFSWASVECDGCCGGNKKKNKNKGGGGGVARTVRTRKPATTLFASADTRTPLLGGNVSP
jgi:hypothetical protein